MARKIDYAAMFTLRKDGRYQGSYKDDSGTRRYVYDRDPEKLYRRMLHVQSEAKDDVITFRRVAEEWEREHREQIEDRTWKNYSPHYDSIVAEHGETPFSDVSALDVVNDLSRTKAQGLSATIVKTRRSIYNMIFDYAVVHGYAKYNPVGSVKLPRGLKQGKRRAPTQEQMQIILRNVDAPFGLFPFLLLCTGLRKSEALALLWSDVDFKRKEISITKSIDNTNGANPKYKSPKTDAGVRTVPILDVLLAPLKRAHAARTSDLVFPCPPSNRGGRGGGLFTERAYEGMWNRYCASVGLMENGKPAITAHNLRHGTATLMFEMGVDELTAQKILGHSRVEITREIYTDLRANQKIKSIEKLNQGLTSMVDVKKI